MNQYLISVTIEHPRLSHSKCSRLPNCTNNPWRLTTLSRANKQISLLKSKFYKLLFSKLWMILKILNRLNESSISPSHKRLNPTLILFYIFLSPYSLKYQSQSSCSSTSTDKDCPTRLESFIYGLIHLIEKGKFC